jgi:hypothetical protein
MTAQNEVIRELSGDIFDANGSTACRLYGVLGSFEFPSSTERVSFDTALFAAYSGHSAEFPSSAERLDEERST